MNGADDFILWSSFCALPAIGIAGLLRCAWQYVTRRDVDIRWPYVALCVPPFNLLGVAALAVVGVGLGLWWVGAWCLDSLRDFVSRDIH